MFWRKKCTGNVKIDDIKIEDRRQQTHSKHKSSLEPFLRLAQQTKNRHVQGQGQTYRL